MKAYKLVIFDLDGTLYRGSEPLKGALETVQTLTERGVKVAYLTNNSSLPIDTYLVKLGGMGFPVVRKQVLTSALLAGEKLCGHVTSAFIIGETGLVEALAAKGVRRQDERAEAVVCGLDKKFTYAKLDSALQLLRNPNVRFVATNTDATYPMERGAVIPGAGSIVAAVATASGRTPELCGKPDPFGIQTFLRRFDAAPSETLVVGDRFETDIQAGIAAGCDVHMVLSGVTEHAPAGISHSRDLTALV